MMVTIKDVAREAGVSIGTVSNVINKKGNVSARKIDQVEQAMQRLNYEINASARQLKQQKNKTIAVLIPSLYGRHYIDLYERVREHVESHGYNVDIYTTDNHFEREYEICKKLISSNVACIVALPSYVDPDLIYNRIPESISLVIVGPRPNNVTRTYMQVAFNYEVMALDIVSYVLSKKYKVVALFIDDIRSSEVFTSTIKRSLEEKNVVVKLFGSTNLTTTVKAFDILDHDEPFQAVITSNLLRANATQWVYKLFGSGCLPEIITLNSKASVLTDDMTNVLRNFSKIGDVLAEALIGQMQRGEPVSGAFIVDSDPIITKYRIPLPRRKNARPLSILLPNDHFADSLQKISPQFEKSTGIPIRFTRYPGSHVTPLSNETLDGLADAADIMIVDAACLPQLKESLFLRRGGKPELARDFARNAAMKNTIFSDMTDSDFFYCPFRTSCQMMFYRKDILRDYGLNRRFYEDHFRPLSIPTRIQDYDLVASYCTKTINPLSPIQYGSAQSSIHTDSFLEELAWRLRASQVSLVGQNGELSLDAPPVADVIWNHLCCMKATSSAFGATGESGAYGYFRGDSALSVFPTGRATLFNESHNYALGNATQWGKVPGKAPLVHASVIGIARQTQQEEEAYAYLDWLFQASTSLILTMLSGQPYKKDTVLSTDILQLYPWMKDYLEYIRNGFFLSEALSPLIYTPAFRSAFDLMLINSTKSKAALSAALRSLQARFAQQPQV